MPLDTSIPLQIGRAPQVQALDPMTMYNAMQERQMNALRAQVLQQEMAQNALTMQNTMEDRRAAAAKAAQERAQAEEFSRILQGGYKPAKNVTMGPGTIQGSTPARFDESSVLNALYAKGSPTMITAYSNLREQIAKQRKAEEEATGQGLTNVKIGAETKGLNLKNLNDEFNNTKTLIGSAGSPDAVLSVFDAKADLIRGIGSDPEKSKRDFLAMLDNPQYGETPLQRFQNAVLHVSQGIAGMQKQISDMATAENTRNKPIEMDLGGKKILVDPVTLKPKAEFEKTLTPDEATKSGKSESARASLEDTLGTMLSEYEKLAEGGDMPSETNTYAGNVAARFKSSELGRFVGADAKAQTSFQRLDGLRRDLLLAIKNATGMTAQEMNSNEELKQMMAALTAAGNNMEAVRLRLGDISKRYGLGKSYAPAEKRAPAEESRSGGKTAKLSDIEHTAKVNNLSVEEVKKRVRALGMAIEGE